uniref:HAT C-terminal dimerisation domain-containing protein n=1 Tax=Latimeria chalumnae TaxID=7897 RepID=H3BAJ7_LATCH
WPKINSRITEQLVAFDHISSFQTWKEMEERLNCNKTFDQYNRRTLSSETEHWHNVLHRLVALTQTLAVQNLAFQATDRLYEPGNGNFLKFVELMGMFDGIMKEHLKKNKKQTNIQNELIDLLASKIRGKILFMTRPGKQDVNMVMEIQERFLAFAKLDDSSGEGMTEVLLQKLNEIGLPLTDMRGQGYDNRANMKGKNKGVQKRVPFFVPCNAHSLNLVLSDAAGCCTDTVNFFGVIQAIFVYFSTSTYRWDILLKHVGKSGLTVKQLFETRWESRVEAVRAIRYQVGEVYDALLSIADDATLTGTCGTKSHAEARSIAGKVLNFTFLCSLVVWHDILFEVNIASKTLQAVEFDLHEAIEQLAVNYWSDCSSASVLAIARELAESLGIQGRFSEEIQRKKTQFDYKARNEPVVNPEQSFKVNFFYQVVDTAIQSVRERFSQLQEHSKSFSVLYKIPELSSSSREVLFEQCTDLQSALMDGDSKDIDASELCDELMALARRVEPKASPKQVLVYICWNNMTSVFPNTFIALCILLTLSITVATAEHSFSKLKLIKTYLQSSMSQMRLVGLETISVEHDLAEAIRDFAAKKAREVL